MLVATGLVHAASLTEGKPSAQSCRVHHPKANWNNTVSFAASRSMYCMTDLRGLAMQHRPNLLFDSLSAGILSCLFKLPSLLPLESQEQ